MTKFEGVIVILDVGKKTACEENEKHSFFTDAKEFVARFIERKIMSEQNGLLGIILLGSKKTKNNLSEQSNGAFSHIEVLFELQSPIWQMIRTLPEVTTKHRGDWFDALIVAAEQFKHETKIKSKKVILITNFKSKTSLEESGTEQVMNGFKEDNIELDVIGLDIYDDCLKGEDIDVARKFVDMTEGVTATFEHAMSCLLYHKKKIANSVPWNVDMTIGPNIRIPVSVYIRLKDEPAVKKWIKSIKNVVTNAASTSESIVKSKIHVNTENQTVIDPENVINGYHYGQAIIPFTHCDKSLLYDSGDKSLSVYGFTKSSYINWQVLGGDNLSYIFGRKDDPKAQQALICLVECMREMDIVAIARKVHNKGNAPNMFALMPVIDNNNYICLSMARLCYKDEIKFMAFPTTNLKRYTYTNDQVEAFKELIKAMDLTNAYDETFDDSEAFPIAETVSPIVQYILDCIAFRALNPTQPIPQPRDDIMMLFKVPPIIEKNSREPLKKLRSLFTLTKKEKKTTKRALNSTSNNALHNASNEVANSTNDVGVLPDIPKVKLPKTVNTTNKIGTLDPINDFKTLSASGKTMNDLSTEMIEAIENLICYNLDGTYSKAITALKFFRDECVKTNPSPYNTWLNSFKKTLISRNKEDILNLIIKDQLDLILKHENESSLIDSIESQENIMNGNNMPDDATELTMDTEINDLFDEM